VLNDGPVAFPGQLQREAANVTHRVGGAALAGNRITIVAGVFSEPDFLDRARLVEEYQRHSHRTFLQGDSLDGLVHLSQWTLLWTTNTILWIRTAVRRFLTKPVGALGAAEMRQQSRRSVQRSPITSPVQLADAHSVDADSNVYTAMYKQDRICAFNRRGVRRHSLVGRRRAANFKGPPSFPPSRAHQGSADVRTSTSNDQALRCCR